jgi:membrane fusion protein, multidrug efflux system
MAAVAGALSACHSRDASRYSSEHPVLAPTLVVQAAPTTVYATVPGGVVSLKRADISSRLSGYVRRVDVNAGDTVHAGQPLLQIDLADVTAALQRARAGLSAAQAVYDEAKANYERDVALFRPGVVSKMQLDSATRAYHTARSGLLAARAVLATAHADVNYADLRAPFDGIVVEKLVDAGDLATPGKPLLVVEDESALEVRSDVSSDVYDHLRIGEEIPLSAGSDQYTGTLAFAVSAADPQTHTHLIRLSLPPGTGLGSGVYVRVHIPIGVHPEIRIPRGAVTERAGITGVFVVDPEGRAAFRLVRLGSSSAEWTEVQSGLASGERIIVAPDSDVDNGTSIAARAARLP